MIHQIDAVRKTRHYLLQIVTDLNNEELNEVPAGFNNNIIWNLGHLVAAQQGICYLRAGLPAKVDDAFFAAYRPGSKPESKVDEGGIARIKELLFTTLDSLEQDYAAGLWTQYPAWNTRYGVKINSIESAIGFLLFHEGLHSGYIMALKRVVKPAEATV